MSRISLQVIGLMFLTTFSLGCAAQEDKGAGVNSQTQSAPQTSSFAGCYDLKMGRWWPWGFGEDDMFATPPNRIKLLPERGTHGFEKNGFVIREMTPKGGDLKRFSFWQLKSSDQIDLTWTTGFSGVTLELKGKGNHMRGWAHPFWDFPRLPRIARVTAQRIPCDAAH